MAAQYHEAGKHLKNAGRVLAGKEAVTEAKPTGKVAKTIAHRSGQIGPVWRP